MSLHIVILAAGQGKRMRSKTPKVLHSLGGKPMLMRVVETALLLNPQKIHVIIGHESEAIKKSLPMLPVNWVYQEQQAGTGHAVLQALPHIPDDSFVLILSADVPLIQADTLQLLIDRCQASRTQAKALGLLLALVPDPTGLGRIIRNHRHEIQAIVEEKDATEMERQINEIYSGICYVAVNDLKRWLPKLNGDNAQQEYYLTEIISMAVREKKEIIAVHAKDFVEVLGINNRLQLEELERALQTRLAESLMLSGVTVADAARLDIRGELICGIDVFIDVNNVFMGKVMIGDGSSIAPNCLLNNVIIGENCEILANSVLENCQIGDNCQVGPFARIRPGTQLGRGCKIGNFVETKNAILDEGSKASHLSYLGDVTIGKHVNIGAGTITCNYDGANKHHTVIEDEAFIGSDTQLVAPVVVGRRATIGAGSTIRKNVPPDELTLSESKQKTITGWKRPQKKEQ
ncbi:bifunctional UDP-N-acetylglucosamine diphosphorylase/glucosamine-1-phosphate N-acetyltransferase GlmU [Legionella londiniensis]|uniref:Bifunctional protein GlmU n=1 Tax=Legionella londiniensis TaxID=45068 RepID=A0A0W0VI83_9GAMM|nr:bifunctional UDP-N-acetylglucosamine diphosphorylase/glucosamine-1-phosphate N-acetyltransferase GlmU [Legionella londiniensis]KTD19836.1 bifunctional N-acetylglucosamine-1-phosphate uridyltransferase / glucosamine-1-phosphate N-acetyltransferase [Legionella londiniensis]STX92251.1 UDP-N-acetylglucosamine pyrophosphorylase [Legionella londiniensis]